MVLLYCSMSYVYREGVSLKQIDALIYGIDAVKVTLINKNTS